MNTASDYQLTNEGMDPCTGERGLSSHRYHPPGLQRNRLVRPRAPPLRDKSQLQGNQEKSFQ